MIKDKLQQQFESLLISVYKKGYENEKELNFDIELLNRVYKLGKSYGELNSKEILNLIEREVSL